jgi:predicted nucleotidyltransferase
MTSVHRPTNSRIPISYEDLAEFCRRWKVAELALFGSALRSDFTPASDVDLLVTFEPEADRGLLDHVAMEEVGV